ncbi:MAG TPA: hypothetical protein VHR66_26285, partial [Gemmataceae bacterium]|nr:hypothetical protein [Gemmataceae bacterium]
WSLIAIFLVMALGCAAAIIFWFESIGWIIALSIIGGLAALCGAVFLIKNIGVLAKPKRSTTAREPTSQLANDDDEVEDKSDDDESDDDDSDVKTPPAKATWTMRAQRRKRFDCHSKSYEGTVQVAISPDGRWLASAGGSQGGDICVFDLATNELLATLEAHTYYGITALVISSDSRKLASTGDNNDGKVRVWSLPDGAMLYDLKGCSFDNHALAITPDGKLLAGGGGGDNTIRLWNLDDGSEVKVLKGHAAKVKDVGFSPDGRYLISGDDQAVVRIWSVPEGEMLVRCRPDEGSSVQCMVVSPDGTFVATGEHSWVRLWSIPDGRLIKSLEHSLWVHGLAVSPDSRLIASSGSSTSAAVNLWSVPDGKKRGELKGHRSSDIDRMAISADGRFLASGAEDQDVILWSLPDGAKLATLEDHPGHISSLAITPDSRTVVVGSKDGSVTIWDCTPEGAGTPAPVRPAAPVANKPAVAPAAGVDIGKAMAVLDDAYLVRHDEELEQRVNAALDRIAQSGDEGIRTLLDRVFRDMTLNGTQLRVHFGGDTAWNEWLKKRAALEALCRARATAALPRLSALAVAECTASQFYEILKPALARTVAELKSVPVSAPTAEVEPARITCPKCQAKIRIKPGTPAGTFKCPRCQSAVTVPGPAPAAKAPATPASSPKKAPDRLRGRRKFTFEGHGRATKQAAFSPDGRFLATSVGVWRMPGGEPVGLLEKKTYYEVHALAISPDSKLLLTTSNDDNRANGLYLYDLEAGQQLRSWEGPGNFSSCAAFTPDGSLLVTATYSDHSLNLWTMPDGTLVKTLKGHASDVKFLAVTPDGKFIVSGDDQGVVRMWSLPAGEMLVRCRTDEGNGVVSLAVSADGKYAVDGTHTWARIWSIPDGKLLGKVEQDFWIYGLAISPDSRILAASGSSYTGLIRLWDLPGGSKQRELKGHRGEVNCLAMSPDGRFLASGADDQDVILWRLPDGRQLATLEDHPGHIQRVNVSPDGSLVAVGSEDGTVTVWEVTDG